MNTLRKRVAALEGGGDGLVLLFVSALPGDERETATYAGVTYTQAQNESPEQFRVRLSETLKNGKARLVWLSALDVAV